MNDDKTTKRPRAQAMAVRAPAKTAATKTAPAKAKATPAKAAKRIYRDVRVCQIYEGTSDVQKIILQRML